MYSDAKASGLRMLELPAPLARFSRRVRQAYDAAVSRRYQKRLPEVRGVILDGEGLFVSAQDLDNWLNAKASEYLGLGSGHIRFLNAGRVDGYWTACAFLQSMRREAAPDQPVSTKGAGSVKAAR